MLLATLQGWDAAGGSPLVFTAWVTLQDFPVRVGEGTGGELGSADDGAATGVASTKEEGETAGAEEMACSAVALQS